MSNFNMTPTNLFICAGCVNSNTETVVQTKFLIVYNWWHTFSLSSDISFGHYILIVWVVEHLHCRSIIQLSGLEWQFLYIEASSRSFQSGKMGQCSFRLKSVVLVIVVKANFANDCKSISYPFVQEPEKMPYIQFASFVDVHKGNGTLDPLHNMLCVRWYLFPAFIECWLVWRVYDFSRKLLNEEICRFQYKCLSFAFSPFSELLDTTSVT